MPPLWRRRAACGHGLPRVWAQTAARAAGVAALRALRHLIACLARRLRSLWRANMALARNAARHRANSGRAAERAGTRQSARYRRAGLAEPGPAADRSACHGQGGPRHGDPGPSGGGADGCSRGDRYAAASWGPGAYCDAVVDEYSAADGVACGHGHARAHTGIQRYQHSGRHRSDRDPDCHSDGDGGCQRNRNCNCAAAAAATMAAPTTPAPAATATLAPTPGPAAGLVYPAPVLLLPTDGFVFAGGGTAVWLRWEPVGELGEDDYYAVSVRYVKNGGSVYTGSWYKGTEWQVPKEVWQQYDQGQPEYDVGCGGDAPDGDARGWWSHWRAGGCRQRDAPLYLEVACRLAPC